MSTWSRVLAWDEATLLRVVRWQRPLTVKLLRAVTHLGDAQSWVLLCLVLAATGSEVGVRLSLRLGVATGLAAVVAQVIKRVSRRRRPTAGITGFSAFVANPDAFSFPSGHTAASVAAAMAWAGEGAALGGLGTALAALIGFSRIALGAHYPLDVGAGALLGVACGLAARGVVGGF